MIPNHKKNFEEKKFQKNFLNVKTLLKSTSFLVV